MYTQRSDQELLSLLKEHEGLTFESRLSLKEELEKRQLEVVPELNETFTKSINVVYEQIKTLEFLPRIGFEHDKTSSIFVLRRTLRANIINALAGIVGFVILFLGIDLVGSGFMVLKLNLSPVFSVVFIIIGIALCILGALLGYKNIDRFVSFADFRFSISSNECTLFTRIDWKRINLKRGIEKLELVPQKSKTVLLLDKTEVFSVNQPDLIISLTLAALISKIRGGQSF